MRPTGGACAGPNPLVALSGSETFDRLRGAIATDAGLRSDVEAALLFLLERLNPSDAGVRWAVGSSVEWILASAMYQAGAIALPEGHRAVAIDLHDLLSTLRSTFSVKSSFSPDTSTFRLTNGMGGAGAGFAEPTLFLHPRLPGIVFADPTTHAALRRAVRDRADATTITVGAVRAHATEHPECVAEVVVPVNPRRGIADPGTAFAQELITSGRFPRLERLFLDVSEASQPRTLVDDLGALRQMHREGLLTEDQMRAAVEQLVSGDR